MVDGDDSFYVNGVRPADYERCRTEERPWGPVDEDDYCVRRGRYEDYVTRDVVTHIDGRYRTRADRAGRALAGFSMGGFGALMLAMRHPEVFSAAVSHAGVDSLLYAGPRPWARGATRRLEDLSSWGREYESEIPGIGDHVRALLGPDPANWRAHDPVALAETLQDGQLALYLDCGTEDDFGFDALAQDLHEALQRRGIRHAFALVRGGHDGDFLEQRLDDGMRFVAAHFSAQR
jgi:S-formylglutathione hydrolase FrmB